MCRSDNRTPKIGNIWLSTKVVFKNISDCDPFPSFNRDRRTRTLHKEAVTVLRGALNKRLQMQRIFDRPTPLMKLLLILRRNKGTGWDAAPTRNSKHPPDVGPTKHSPRSSLAYFRAGFRPAASARRICVFRWSVMVLWCLGSGIYVILRLQKALFNTRVVIWDVVCR